MSRKPNMNFTQKCIEYISTYVFFGNIKPFNDLHER